MGKAKVVKKSSPAKPVKISTSLFKRRLSKNSTGQVDKESPPPKGKKASSPVRGKGKSKTEPTNNPPKKTTTSPPPKKVVKKKSPTSPTTSPSKKEKSLQSVKKKVEKKGRKPDVVQVGRRKEAESPSPPAKGRGRWSSTASSSSTNSSISESSKTLNKRNTKNVNPEPPPQSEEEEEQSWEEDNSDEDEEQSESGSGSEEDTEDSDNKKSNNNKKPLAKKNNQKETKGGKKQGKGVSTGKNKMVKKTVLATKKKKNLPIKGKKSTNSNNTKKSKSTKSSSSSSDEKSKANKTSTTVKRKYKEKQNKETGKASTKKSKLKLRPKHTRMASLNAKAILEASFSFENQEKRQKSPAPSSTSPNKVKDEEVTSKPNRPSVSTSSVSTSPPPPQSTSPFIPIQNQKPGSVQERKRKSSEGMTRRESSGSDSNHVTSPKNNSRRNSSLEKKVPGPKKKSKVSTASTSTGTSPLPSPDHFREDKPKNKVKKGGKGVDSAGGARSDHVGSSRNSQDSSVQANQFKSTGSQSKERKSSSSVAQFGTVYQPAGPLIEPHKTVPAGLLPESVKLPADLKVTYQAHPPPTNSSTVSHSSSSSKSRKHAASSSSTTTTPSSSSPHKEKGSGSSSSGGQILHQPYKSSSASASSSSRQVSYSSTGASGSYMNMNAATVTGSPLLISQQSAASSLNLPHPGHHSISSGAPSQQLPASVGAPSAGGLFYSSTGFTPHHSPFAPNKYPMVPPESYRTHSPYQNSYLYPSTTPQQSQYFMTPFYTPPLTPNPNPVMSLGTMGGQQRPLSYPSLPAASFYPQNPSLPPQQGMHPSSYLVTSPHHPALQQTQPTAPGHAGPFPLNPCTQPACPCPTESCPPSNTSNSRQQQPQSVSNALHQVPKGLGAKQSKALATPRPIRTKQMPSNATTPPITIQLMSTNQDSQARQLESAKTFTEQYSLPDDITITPIIVNNASALLLKNTSISIVSPPTSSPKSATNNTPQGRQGSPVNKRKERDIVHVIDPRSGIKTTIAKHISNRNLLVKSNVNKQQPKASPRPNMKKLGAVGVGKLNPDLDVIVINNNNNGNADDCDDSITENIAHNTQRGKKSPQQQLMNTTKLNKKSITAGMVTSTSTLPAHSIGIGRGGKSNVGNKRVVVTVNENGKSTGVRNSIQNSPVNYSLPPGISVSSGSPNYNRSQAVHNSRDPNNFVHIQTFDQKGKKRISLNECIDGLQKKRLKLLEEHVNVDGSSASVNGNVIPRTTSHQLPSKFNNGGRFHSRTAGSYSSGTSGGTGKFSDSSYSSARVRDSQILRGCTVIQSCDAEVAVSAVVLDHESYIRKNLRLSPKGLKIKNGLNKGNNNKFHSSPKNHLFLPQQQQRELNYVVGMSKVKSSNKMMGGGSSQRNTRSAAANAKIRTRFSANKPKGGGDSSPPRSRSRLLRGAGGSSGAGNQRGDSDSSNNNSRSNSAVRISNGHGSSSSGMGRGVVDRESKKCPTQAFINAVADLYQYRRNVLLRVPRSGVGVFPSASSINLSTLNPPPRNSSSSPGDKDTSQLSPSNPSQNEHTVISSFSASVATVGLGGHGMKQPVGSMAANAAKKRAAMKPLSPAAINGALLQMGLAMRRTPKWSNGWRFEGEPYEIKVYLNNDDPSVLRRCYPAMRHEGGDVIQTRDCVLLKSGSKKNDLPFIAKIAALWENPADGEMMFSLLWYYRPEHTEMGRTKEDMPDEIFASKHIDVNSVATIDDRCYVLTTNEYCRYRKRLKQLQEGLPNKPLLSLSGSAMINNNAAANIAGAVWSGRPSESEPNRAPTPGKISPEAVFFCRKVYDFRQKRIMKNPS